jgi:phosphoglycolate phosphatase-like HAD superfamily hydrolase
MANPHVLFLFDVDGVLVNPRGYKQALYASLNYFADRMGQPAQNLTYEEIARFEASGLTNEWESLAMCVSLLLTSVLNEKPDLTRNTFALTLDPVRRGGVEVPRPDYTKLAAEVKQLNPEGLRPSHTVRDLMLKRTPKIAHALLHELLDDVYSIETPTTRIFQHYTLGSERFEDTYNRSSDIKVASQLLLNDIPHIQSGVLEEFLSRDFDVAIYSARPSLPPNDLATSEREALDSALYPPEGDLAAGLLGVIDAVPLIAGGRIAWLAAEYKRDITEFMKPAPVQALAAIGAALSAQEKSALEAAVTFFDEGELVWPLDQLKDQHTHVIVFEDSVGGIRAVQKAVTMLREAGIQIDVEAVGVAVEPSKREALEPVADRIIEEINLALSPFLNQT